MKVEALIPKESSREPLSCWHMSVQTCRLVIYPRTIILLYLNWPKEIADASKQITQCLFRELYTLLSEWLQNLVLIESFLCNVVDFCEFGIELCTFHAHDLRKIS